MTFRRPTIFALTFLALGLVRPALADETSVAVAANFTAPAKEIAAAFHDKTGHVATLSFGATGAFYAQITQDAPFEVFLAADQARPKKAIEAGFAVAGTEFTYAVGKLVLWSKNPDLVQGPETLKTASLAKIAYCNPTAAPYGAAAVEAMKSLQVFDALQPRLVQGADIAQAFQFVASGNAELGFVALSQLAGDVGGSRWLVPQENYSPILQDAVLVKKGADKPAAKAFLAFLRGPEARAIIERYGYSSPGD